MSLLKFGDSVVVFSPIPHGKYIHEALELLKSDNGKEALEITHLFIANFQHNIAAISWKNAYPDLNIIAGYNVDLGEECPIDFVLQKEQANRILSGSDLESELDLSGPWKDDLKVVFLSYHKNKDVVLFHPELKTLFEGDVVFNMGAKDENDEVEQYSSTTGFPHKHYPYTGWSFFLRFCHPGGLMGSWLCNRVNLVTNPKAVEGLKVLENLDFEVIVPCHGNVMDKNAKETFRGVFKSVL